MFGGEKDASLLQQIQLLQTQITRSDMTIKRDIQELSGLSGCSDDDQIRQHVAAVKQQQTKQHDFVQQLRALSGRVRDAAERAELCRQVDRHEAETVVNNQQLRQATALAMATFETEKRAALFQQSDNADDQSALRRRAKAAAMGKDSQSANNKLSELVALMNEQVSVSGSTLDKLVASSELIGDTEHEFHNMSSTIQVSNKLLSKYNRRELTDKVLFALAVCFFFGTVLYIVRKRMFPNGFGIF